MHAQRIVQEFLAQECPSIHAKRRECVAAIVAASREGGLGVVKIGKALGNTVALRHRIKRADRLLSNEHLAVERLAIYRALAHRLLPQPTHAAIVIDWSDLLPDGSQQLLRACLAVQGRAFTIYDEVHPRKHLANAAVHRRFMISLRSVLPSHCRPLIITDAGFRATWFKMLTELGFAWIGRIRNRDTIQAQTDISWHGCKELYAAATGRPKDLGQFSYVRSNRVTCRLILIRRKPKGRTNKTVFGTSSRSAHSKKQSKGQREPWLLAVSPCLYALSAKTVVDLYGKRMQIEQTFRDLKSAQWGMGLSTSQTRKPNRLAALLLIATLLSFALWLIGLAARRNGYRICYGSRKKAATTLSILGLARQWLADHRSQYVSQRQCHDALRELASMVITI